MIARRGMVGRRRRTPVRLSAADGHESRCEFGPSLRGPDQRRAEHEGARPRALRDRPRVTRRSQQRGRAPGARHAVGQAAGALHRRGAHRRGGPGGAGRDGGAGARRGPHGRAARPEAQGGAGDRLPRRRLDRAGAADRGAAGQGGDRRGRAGAARRPDRAGHRRSGKGRLQAAREAAQAGSRVDRAGVQPRRRPLLLAHHRIGDLRAFVPQARHALRPRSVAWTVRARGGVPWPERLRRDRRRRRASAGRPAHRAQDDAPGPAPPKPCGR